jgi:hypothetical protein
MPTKATLKRHAKQGKFSIVASMFERAIPEIGKFLPYPSEKTLRSKDADGHNPPEMAFLNPLRNSHP